MRPTLASAARITVISLFGLMCFIVGILGTAFALLHLLAPPMGCEAPCDAPGYVAIGYTLLVGPVVGALMAAAGVWGLRTVYRPTSRLP